MMSLFEQATGLAGREVLILLSMFSAVVFLVLAGTAVLSAPPAIGQRLGLAAGRSGNGPAPSLGWGSRITRSRLRRLEHSLAPQNQQTLSSVRRLLVRAGYYGPSAVPAYYVLRIALAGAFLAVALVGLPVVAGLKSVEDIYQGVAMAAAAGFYAPALVLRQIVARRQRHVRESFPDVLDLLLVCVEAGLALNAAVVRVADELRGSHSLLCEHFQLVALEMAAGASRETALRNMAERTGVDEVGALVSHGLAFRLTLDKGLAPKG
jgi:tight adherence protein C